MSTSTRQPSEETDRITRAIFDVGMPVALISDWQYQPFTVALRVRG